MEIKCQIDATEVFIADLIACSTCFGHHYVTSPGAQEYYTVVAACGISCCGFSSCWSGVQLRVTCPVCRMLTRWCACVVEAQHHVYNTEKRNKSGVTGESCCLGSYAASYKLLKLFIYREIRKNGCEASIMRGFVQIAMSSKRNIPQFCLGGDWANSHIPKHAYYCMRDVQIRRLRTWTKYAATQNTQLLYAWSI